ncbi:GNAT family N-acetyltransferase [Corynebacterium lowii]|uniref:GNAT family N-acetyltransferase n=1 Tax=Corynebacterium lowii TaxID=1544413 RepID=UPI001B80981D|nr:N-acetyltransferase [Corynebacterium lowii]MDP9851494.1 ribosomal protein S18 acetylase RimI-like enzyme [Corynebacterium lowii]
MEILKEIGMETFNDTFAQYNTEENMRAFFDSAYNTEQLLKELDTPSSQFFFIYTEGDAADSPAGYVKINVGTAQSEPRGDDRLELERIYIRSAYKRQGLGKALFEKVLSRAVEEKKDYVWLGVWEHNTAAQKFYATLGFQEVSDHIFYLGDDPQRDIILEKDIR